MNDVEWCTVGSVPTKSPVQPNKNLTDAEGDCGVSRDDDGLVSTFRVPAVVDLKLQQSRELSDTHQLISQLTNQSQVI